MTIVQFLLAMISPMISRILVALSFQVVTITGVELVMSTLRSQLISNLNSVPVAGLQMFALAGGGTALGIILGACATRMVLNGIQNSVKLLGVNGS